MPEVITAPASPGSVENLIDPLGQLNPLIERHGRAGDVRELLGLGVGVSLETRHQLEHFLGVHPGASACGDGAAGGENTHPGSSLSAHVSMPPTGTEHQGSDKESENRWFLQCNHADKSRHHSMCHERATADAKNAGNYYTVFA